MKRFGIPVKTPPTKEILDGAIHWEISPETIKAIEEIEENSRLALIRLQGMLL